MSSIEQSRLVEIAQALHEKGIVQDELGQNEPNLRQSALILSIAAGFHLIAAALMPKFTEATDRWQSSVRHPRDLGFPLSADHLTCFVEDDDSTSS